MRESAHELFAIVFSIPTATTCYRKVVQCRKGSSQRQYYSIPPLRLDAFMENIHMHSSCLRYCARLVDGSVKPPLSVELFTIVSCAVEHG